MDEQVLVHCPSCGAAVMVVPTIQQVRCFRTELQVTFLGAIVAHVCKND